jgi:uncharacterized protein
MALLEKLRAVLQAIPAVRLAAAFGSVARGADRCHSDVDLALRLEPDSPELRLKIEAELGRTAGREVDLVYLGNAPPLLRFEIARDGVLLVARAPHDWPDFRARAMIDWWDWAPTARRINEAAIQRLREKVASPHGPP